MHSQCPSCQHVDNLTQSCTLPILLISIQLIFTKPNFSNYCTVIIPSGLCEFEINYWLHKNAIYFNRMSSDENGTTSKPDLVHMLRQNVPKWVVTLISVTNYRIHPLFFFALRPIKTNNRQSCVPKC